MEQDSVIKVPYVCKCGKKMLVKKKTATQLCTVKCPACSNEYRIKFDIHADPQTYTFVEPEVKQEENKTIYGAGINTASTGREQKAARRSEGTRIVRLDELQPPMPKHEDEPVDNSLSGPCDAWLVQLKLFNRTAERYQLKYGETTIGRFDVGEQSDIPIRNDVAISRRSISITITPMGKFTDYRLKVLKATNPVFVNGKQIGEGKHVMLNNGDKIRLGNTKFRFEGK